MKAQTHHIQACRRLWLEHLANCPPCYFAESDHFCDVGKALHDELCSSITANRMCEQLIATEAACETGNSNQ